MLQTALWGWMNTVYLTSRAEFRVSSFYLESVAFYLHQEVLRSVGFVCWLVGWDLVRSLTSWGRIFRKRFEIETQFQRTINGNGNRESNGHVIEIQDGSLAETCTFCMFLISAPRLGVYYFLSLTLSVRLSIRLSICNGQTSNRFFFFLFLDGIAPFFDRQFFMTPSTKRCSSIFDLGLLTPKIFTPPNLNKIAYKSAVCQIDRRCLSLLGGFREWPIQ